MCFSKIGERCVWDNDRYCRKGHYCKKSSLQCDDCDVTCAECSDDSEGVAVCRKCAEGHYVSSGTTDKYVCKPIKKCTAESNDCSSQEH